MANKKIFMSVTATAVIASAFLATDKADAATYQVKSGDSLWSIAQKFDTTVSNLKAINNLAGDIIYPNQTIETEKNQSTVTNTKPAQNATPSVPTQTSNKAATYTVKPGDTLSAIATKHNISLADLMSWNKLNTTLIYPGNVFVVSKPGTSNPTQPANTPKPPNTGGNTNSGTNGGTGQSTVYVVKSGDTLSRIASQNGTTVAKIKEWNNLTSDLILIGQKLQLGGTASNGSTPPPPTVGNNPNEKPPVDTSYNVNELINVAKDLIGTSYVWAGVDPSGFDCSGFIHYVYNKAGMNVGRLSTDGFYSRSYYVDKPQLGDLVFFENTYKAGISHMGIYIGNNQFIHAGTSTGVTITSLSNSYWQQRFDGFKRFY